MRTKQNCKQPWKRERGSCQEEFLFATILYDDINRAMPFHVAESLAPDEVYSLIAWLLFQNGTVKEDAVIDMRTLPYV